jgi:hypothetical protein
MSFLRSYFPASSDESTLSTGAPVEPRRARYPGPRRHCEPIVSGSRTVPSGAAGGGMGLGRECSVRKEHAAASGDRAASKRCPCRGERSRPIHPSHFVRARRVRPIGERGRIGLTIAPTGRGSEVKSWLRRPQLEPSNSCVTTGRRQIPTPGSRRTVAIGGRPPPIAAGLRSGPPT